VGDFDFGPNPADGDAGIQGSGGQQDRQEWIRANFAQIFGISAADLQAQGINPRQYAREHRDKIRQFAQLQRSLGIAVPSGQASGDRRQGNSASNAGGPNNQANRYGGRGGRYGMGMRGSTAWIGALIALLALRFLLVDSFVGAHAAILWVLVIGGIMLVARVLLFSWLRNRRFNRRR
jgi:Flp pilus assembly protein TadB